MRNQSAKLWDDEGHMAETPKSESSKDTNQTPVKAGGQTPVNAGKQTAAPKNAKTKKRETLVSLRAHVDRVEARMKRANTLTQDSIEAIESAYDALSHKSGLHASENQSARNKAELDLHVKQLTEQLSGMIEQTRTSVGSELSKVLSNPDVEQLQAALQRADDRITQTDTKLASAISGINRHIADLARALDTQLKAHAVTQEKAVNDLRSDTESAQYALIQRLDRIEEDSSEAFRTIGDKVAAASLKIKQSSDIKTEYLKTNLSQLIETSQEDYKSELLGSLETLKQELQHRIESLEADHKQAVKQRERAQASIETRFESLEFGLETVTTSVSDIQSSKKMSDILSDTSSSETSSISAPFGASDTLFVTPAPAENCSVYGMDMSDDDPKIAKVSYLNPQSRAVKQDNSTEKTETSFAPKNDAIASAEPKKADVQTRAVPYQQDQAHPNTMPTQNTPSFGAKGETAQTHPPLVAEFAAQQAMTDGQSHSAQNSYFGLSTDTQIQSNPYSSDYAEAQSIVESAEYAPTHAPARVYNMAHTSTAPSAPAAGNYDPVLARALDTNAKIPSSAESFDPYILSRAEPSQMLPAHMPNEYVGGDAELPYENPAYADPNYNTQNSNTEYAQEPSMERSRPGGFEKKTKSVKVPSLKLPAFTKQNKRTLGLAVGITAVSLIGIKLMTADPTVSNAAKAPSATLPTQQTQTPDALASAGTQTPATVETIGNYADNKGITTDGTTANYSDLEGAAKSGNPIAEFQLGLSYLQNGRTEDALKYIRMSSDNGLAAAQYRLAKLYEVGEGVTEDAVMARTLTERAARSGNRIAMHDLALYYAEGRGGIDLDMVTAAKWFEKAAERGVVDSQFNLGVLFESGQGLPQNLTDAFVWYSIAAKQGDQLAAQRIDVLQSQLSSELKTSARVRIKDFKPAMIDKEANGIFENLPWATKSDKTAQNDQIELAQNLLQDLGYDAGTPDGAMGPRTRTAIMSFEKSNNMPETGRVSVELIDRLSLAAGA